MLEGEADEFGFFLANFSGPAGSVAVTDEEPEAETKGERRIRIRSERE